MFFGVGVRLVVDLDFDVEDFAFEVVLAFGAVFAFGAAFGFEVVFAFAIAFGFEVVFAFGAVVFLAEDFAFAAGAFALDLEVDEVFALLAVVFFAGEAFLAVVAFLAAGFLAADIFFAAGFFVEAAFDAVDFFAAGFFGAAFLATGFLAAGFFAAGAFFAAGFDFGLDAEDFFVVFEVVFFVAILFSRVNEILRNEFIKIEIAVRKIFAFIFQKNIDHSGRGCHRKKLARHSRRNSISIPAPRQGCKTQPAPSKVSVARE